jgi:hypothetical protein
MIGGKMKISTEQVDLMFKNGGPAEFMMLGLSNLLVNKEIITMEDRNQILALGTQIFLDKHPEFKTKENEEPEPAPTEDENADLEK